MGYLPGWNSIEITSKIRDFFELAGIVLFFVVVVFELLSYFYGHRRDWLIEQAQNATNNRYENELAAARDSAKTAHEELIKIKAPRHLGYGQKIKLKAALSSKPSGDLVIKADVSASDGRAYADEIADFLRDTCGWNVRVDNAMIGGPDTKGLWFTIKDRNQIPAPTASIVEAFESAEITVRHEISVDAGVPTPDEIWLTVGLKPD